VRGPGSVQKLAPSVRGVRRTGPLTRLYVPGA
jgi:hypothetical protein